MARELALRGGWTGYRPLPPGLASQLGKGRPLPHGVAKRAVPYGMLWHLPYYEGYQWYILGRDLVLINLSGMIIDDILRDVFY